MHPLPVDVVTGGLCLVLAVPGPHPDLPLGPGLAQPLHGLGQVEQLGEWGEIIAQWQTTLYSTISPESRDNQSVEHDVLP